MFVDLFARNKRRMHTTYYTTLAHHTTPLTSPHHASAQYTPIRAPPHVPSLQRRIITPMSGQTPLPESALQYTGIVQQPIMPGFDGSAHLVYRRVHSHPHCVAARLQFCSANLALRSPLAHPLQFLLAARRCLACASRSLACAVMMSLAASCLMKCKTEM